MAIAEIVQPKWRSHLLPIEERLPQRVRLFLHVGEERLKRGSWRIGSKLVSRTNNASRETRSRPLLAATRRPPGHVPSAPMHSRRRRGVVRGLTAFLFATFSINACALRGSESATNRLNTERPPLGSSGYFCCAFRRRSHASSRLPNRSSANAIFASTSSGKTGPGCSIYVERVFISPHPEALALANSALEHCSGSSQALCRRAGGLLEKPHMDVHTREASMALI